MEAITAETFIASCAVDKYPSSAVTVRTETFTTAHAVDKYSGDDGDVPKAVITTHAVNVKPCILS